MRRAIAANNIITITGCGNDLVQAIQQYEKGEDERNCRKRRRIAKQISAR
ncbi:hypothetical protein ACEQPO_03075 [Bacillus sp. SL00103]